MAIPTSTIVMALVTAVPFGLAIKDTVQGKSAFDAPTEELLDVDEPTEVMDRAAMDYEQAEQKRGLEIHAAVKSLIPDTKGVPHIDEAQVRATLRGTVAAKANKTTLTFPQYVGDSSVCSTIFVRMNDVWGPAEASYTDDYTLRTWVSGEARQRATFRDPNDDARCELVIEPFVAIPAFVNTTEESTVPLWAVGEPAAKLVGKLGADAFSDATQIRWTRPGVGNGYGETELYARVVKGKIVTITAKFQSTNETMLAMSEQLTSDFGAPSEIEASTWKKAKLSIAALDEGAGEYMITVGAPLPTEDNE